MSWRRRLPYEFANESNMLLKLSPAAPTRVSAHVNSMALPAARETSGFAATCCLAREDGAVVHPSFRRRTVHAELESPAMNSAPHEPPAPASAPARRSGR